MHQVLITPAAGKRLIAKAVARHAAVTETLAAGTVAVIAGTTNGYVAEELLRAIGQAEGFDRARFFRGLTVPAGAALPEGAFPGDVIIAQGQWRRGATIFDVADELKEDDVIVKGANALNVAQQQAGVLIGHPQGGTIAAAMRAVIGRRVRLLVPVGLEKRVDGDINEIAALLNQPGGHGPRMWPVGGEIITEIEALELLTGVAATLIAAGGVYGAEGAVWLAITGTPEQETAACELMAAVSAV